MTTSIFFWLPACLAIIACRVAPGAFFFIAAFPGTVAHELSHLVVAMLLGGRPHSLNLIPVRSATGWTLGSVSFYPNIWNGSFVAMAPLLLLEVGHLLSIAAASAMPTTQLWQGYLTGCLVSSAMPSGADWDIVAEYPLGFAVILLIAALLWQFRGAI